MKRRDFLKTALFSAGAFVSTSYIAINDSVNFPTRPKNVPNGQFIWFVWPSEKGNVRGYLRKTHKLPNKLQTISELCVFHLRHGEPKSPYYLRWRCGNHSLYTPPGALVSRASVFIRESDVWESHAQALSDFATTINLVYDKGQSVVDELANLTRWVQKSKNLREYYPEFRI